MVDLFFLWGLTIILMIDEAVRFKVACHLKSKDAKSLMKTMLYGWFRCWKVEPLHFTSDSVAGKLNRFTLRVTPLLEN